MSTADQEIQKLIQENTRFASGQTEEEVFHQNDLVQVMPYGLSLSNDSQRPFLLLKDASGQHTLPVALNPLEAGVTLSQSHNGVTASTPHRFTQMLLTELGIEAKQAVFVQIKGAHQYLRIYLSGNPMLSSLKVRADEGMSLCLQLGIPLYVTKDFIQRSKVMTAEIEGIGLEVKTRPEMFVKNHRFLM